MINGYATREGTQKHITWANAQDNISPEHYRSVATAFDEPLWLSSLGVGTYLGDINRATDQQVTEAVYASVKSGAMNVIDTAINYRYQQAERSVGEALEAVVADGVSRDGLFVSTKCGYLTPDAADGRSAPQYFQEEYLATGILTPSVVAQGMHSIHPPFLLNQLERSRQNLNLTTLDLLYLHNVAESQLPELKATALMARLETAFGALEEARQQGLIRSYGMATWDCFRVPPTHDHYFSLVDVVRLAEQVGGSQHGFRYLQLPFNLAMPEAAMDEVQPEKCGNISRRRPLLRVAESLGIGVFTSVPLMQGQLLTAEEELLPAFPGLKNPAQRCLQAIRCTPGIIAPLVGHKQADHVTLNCAVAAQPVYDIQKAKVSGRARG